MHGRPAFGSNIGRIFIVCLATTVMLVSSRAPAADLAKEILTADPATAYAGAIHTYVANAAAGLQSPDAAKVKTAREGLIENVRGITPPTASFSDVYCGELAATLTPLTTSSDPRVRLNVAIVTEKVAERTQEASFRLEQILLSEMKDANSGIVLWAMQASKYVLIPVLNVSGTNSKLVPAILDAAKKSTSGAVVGAAYVALSADTSNSTTLPIYIIAVTDLLNFRIQQYAKGLPPEPPMDSRATNFLTGRQVWTSKGFNKTGTVQKIVDLIGIAGNALPAAQGVEKDELGRLLADSAGAIQAVAITEQNPVLQTALQPLNNAGANSRMAPALLAQNINAALAIVITSFPMVHKPGMAASMPSTAMHSATAPAPVH